MYREIKVFVNQRNFGAHSAPYNPGCPYGFGVGCAVRTMYLLCPKGIMFLATGKLGL